MTRTAAFLSVFLYAIHPCVNYVNMFGRPDHHAFIMLFLAIYMHCSAELIESDFRDAAACSKAAITTALCVWISPETLIFLLLAEVVLFFSVYDDPEKLNVLYKKSVFSACAIGIIVFLFCHFDPIDVLCIGTLLSISYATIGGFNSWHTVALFLVAIAFSTLPQVEYDKISIVHVSLYLCASAYYGANLTFHGNNSTKTQKMLWALLLGCTTGAIFLYMFPKFLYGMEANVSEALKNAWLHSNVDELKSPFEFAGKPAMFFALYLVISSVAVYDKIHHLMDKQFSNMDIFWWILVFTCICHMIFASMADRIRMTSAFLSIPLVVELGMKCVLQKYTPQFLKIAITCVLVLCPDAIQKYHPILCSYLSDGDGFCEFCKSRMDMYEQEDRFFEFMDGISKKPVVILTYLGKSSMMLHRTKHKVVATPYHRHEYGILSYFAVMEGEYNETEIKKIFKKTKTSHIFLSKSMTYSTPAARNSLAGLIVDGKYPDWISIVNIPPEFEDVIIAKVDQKKL
jgi:hypothetical protein